MHISTKISPNRKEKDKVVTKTNIKVLFEFPSPVWWSSETDVLDFKAGKNLKFVQFMTGSTVSKRRGACDVVEFTGKTLLLFGWWRTVAYQADDLLPGERNAIFQHDQSASSACWKCRALAFREGQEHEGRSDCSLAKGIIFYHYCISTQLGNWSDSLSWNESTVKALSTSTLMKLDCHEALIRSLYIVLCHQYPGK